MSTLADAQEPVLAALRLYEERRRRDRLLGGFAGLMGEPVWDMLLELFIWAEGGKGRQRSWRSCVNPEAAPQWTALLERLELIERTSALRHGHPAFRLSGAGVALMTRIVTESAAFGRSDLER